MIHDKYNGSTSKLRWKAGFFEVLPLLVYVFVLTCIVRLHLFKLCMKYQQNFEVWEIECQWDN